MKSGNGDDLRTYSADDTCPKLWSSITQVIYYSDSIVKVIGILARLIKGWSQKSRGQALTSKSLGFSTPDELLAAERLLLLSAKPDTAAAFLDQKLVSLASEKEGNLIVTRGRIGERSLSRLLGVPYLPILMPKARTA